MPAPTTSHEFLELLHKSGLADRRALHDGLQSLQGEALPAGGARPLASALVRDGVLTAFHAEQLLRGKWRGFTIGRYQVLEQLGAGDTGNVYLCENRSMGNRVALKVLRTELTHNPTALARFYRAARALAALDHPHVVHAYDIDQHQGYHFLVLEYVDGCSLADLVARGGPLEIRRACHYIRQAALGLQHAHERGLVHRDVKPAHLFVDRQGVVKLLDLGLARFCDDLADDLTLQQAPGTVLGSVDYLAPEQALDSHAADARADIYGLGATLYFALTGARPLGRGSAAQKLLLLQTRRPVPLLERRPDLPAWIGAIVDRMMACEPAERHQSAAEVVEKLAPWTVAPVLPPSESEMRRRRGPAFVGAGPVPAQVLAWAPSPGDAAPFTPEVQLPGPGNGGPPGPGDQRGDLNSRDTAPVIQTMPEMNLVKQPAPSPLPIPGPSAWVSVARRRSLFWGIAVAGAVLVALGLNLALRLLGLH
jgi:serine/threonine protein kinase